MMAISLSPELFFNLTPFIEGERKKDAFFPQTLKVLFKKKQAGNPVPTELNEIKPLTPLHAFVKKKKNCEEAKKVVI